MTYPGGKNGAGIYQRIINHMPPHEVYIEPFLGSGAVLRHKRPARINIGIDMCPDAINLCYRLAEGCKDHLDLRMGNALKLLPSLKMRVADSIENSLNSSQTLIYLDPPYMAETRKGGDLYDFEMSNADHRRLLRMVTKARCMIMLSGYRSPLYDAMLQDFHRIDYQAQTRRGEVTESLWMNFPAPIALHDYSHLGSDYRERERIRRKKARWARRLAAMDRQERLAIMDLLTTTAS